jgi:predicted SAM-dependent methyltransferase
MRNLHIGGEEEDVSEDWEILNVIDADYVDHVGNAKDVSRFEDNAFDNIYCSHVLEHIDYHEELLKTLQGWYRILRPKGRLWISVPNMDRLCELFLDKKKHGLRDRLSIVRMIFGGHTNKYDYHYVCFDTDILLLMMKQAGFEKIWKLDKFGFFKDSSLGNWKSEKGIIKGLSLNVVGEK